MVQGREERRRRAWERFIRVERRELEQRRDGQLAKFLDGPLLPGETEAGLAKLKDEDREGRVRAEVARMRWMTERVNKLQEKRTRRDP